MRLSWILLLALGLHGCGARDALSGGPPSLDAAASAAVNQSVRSFMQSVAQDVTREGPLAWSRYNGRWQFRNLHWSTSVPSPPAS